jgi:hypothetical protein
LGGQLGMVMQDGGLPLTGFAKSLSEDSWDEIAAEFLMTREPRPARDSGSAHAEASSDLPGDSEQL